MPSVAVKSFVEIANPQRQFQVIKFQEVINF